MSADTLKIGQIITEEQSRDAIHVAVVPVTAAQDLLPGQHVSLINPENLEVGYCQPTLGVVDPFLKQPVRKGERFWLFLYPGSITSLRHEWTHPKFPVSQPQVPVTDTQIGIKSAKEESEKWLRSFADEVDADYDEMISVAKTHFDGPGFREYLCEGDKWMGQSTPDEFWTHFAIVTGMNPAGMGGGIFSCSC